MATDENLAKAIARGHELTDINVRRLFVFAGSLLTVIVLILLGMVAVFKSLASANHRFAIQAAVTEPGSHSRVHAAPNYQGPLLQVRPEEDLTRLKAEEAQDRRSYGWIDRPAGVVRLPVDRAMDLLVARGLPPVSPGLTIEALQRQRANPQVWGQPLRP